jgi:hypothetical protein
MRSPDELVLRTDRQLDPILPFHWTDVLLALDLQTRSDVGRHLAERFCRRADVDSLPVPVQDENGRFV